MNLGLIHHINCKSHMNILLHFCITTVCTYISITGMRYAIRLIKITIEEKQQHGLKYRKESQTNLKQTKGIDWKICYQLAYLI